MVNRQSVSGWWGSCNGRQFHAITRLHLGKPRAIAGAVRPRLSGYVVRRLCRLPHGVQGMSVADIVEVVAKVAAMWALGFSIGWSVTIFKDAMNKV